MSALGREAEVRFRPIADAGKRWLGCGAEGVVLAAKVYKRASTTIVAAVSAVLCLLLCGCAGVSAAAFTMSPAAQEDAFFNYMREVEDAAPPELSIDWIPPHQWKRARCTMGHASSGEEGMVSCDERLRYGDDNPWLCGRSW